MKIQRFERILEGLFERPNLIRLYQGTGIFSAGMCMVCIITPNVALPLFTGALIYSLCKLWVNGYKR